MISVIIPLYNKESVIKKTIDSILAQSYHDYEIIVVDDGSSDNSVEIVRGYKDSRVLLYSKKNGGPSSARNYGVQKSNGQWVLFLDADDTLFPDALEKMISATHINEKIDVVSCNFNIVCGDKVKLQTLKPFSGIVPKNKKIKWLFFGNCYPRPGAALLRRDLVLSNLFPEDLRRYEDDSAMIQWIKNAREVYMLSDVVLNYYRDTAAASKPVKDYNKDFIFHMNFEEAGFWEKCMLGSLYGSGLDSYPEQKANLKQMYSRYDFYRFFGRSLLLSRYLIRRFLYRK